MVKKSLNKCPVMIIKRDGHLERFDEKKIYTACYEACLNAHLSREKADNIAKKIVKSIIKKIGMKKEIKSDAIFKYAIELLNKEDKDAAFLFETHRDVS